MRTCLTQEIIAICLTLCLYSSTVFAQQEKKAWPPVNVVDGLGVSVHWRGELDKSSAVINPLTNSEIEQQANLIADTGLKIIREDIHWQWKNKSKDRIDFSRQHVIYDICRSHGLRLMTVLAFVDPRFENRWGISTEEGRQSFARFCGQAVKEFKGKGIIWEMWNEANSSTFWASKATGIRNSTQEYMAAMRLAIKTMRESDPDCIIIAPSSATFDKRFFESCFQAGLLDDISAVSVHPYCDSPEWNMSRYLELQNLINTYSSKTRNKLPIINSELGFSRVFLNLGRRIRSEDEQAALMIRSILIDQIAGVPVHIIYTNRDYDANLTWDQASFGIVAHDGKPKSAFKAIKNFTTQLNGCAFGGILEVGTNDIFERNVEDNAIYFNGSNSVLVVAWTSAAKHMAKVQLPGIPRSIISMKGESIPLPADTGNPKEHLGRKVAIELSVEPVYIRIERKDMDDPNNEML